MAHNPNVKLKKRNKLDAKAKALLPRRIDPLGDPVSAVLYDGHHEGHGRPYMTGMVRGEIVRDFFERPLPLSAIGMVK